MTEVKLFPEVRIVKKRRDTVQIGKTDLIRSGWQLNQITEAILGDTPERLKPDIEAGLLRVKQAYLADPLHSGKIVMRLSDNHVSFSYEASGLRTFRQVTQTALGMGSRSLSNLGIALRHDPGLTVRTLVNRFTKRKG